MRYNTNGMYGQNKTRSGLQTIDEEAECGTDENQPFLMPDNRIYALWWVGCWDACMRCLDADCCSSTADG